MQVTLYTKPDCPLCDDLKADLQALQTQFELAISQCNIEEDAELFERFRYLIPVLDIEDGSLLYPPHTWQKTVAALEEASRVVVQSGSGE